MKLSILLLVASAYYSALAFNLPQHARHTHLHARRPSIASSSKLSSAESANEEVEKLRKQAAKIRQQLAELEGKSLSQVQEEAQLEKDMKAKRQQEMAAASSAAASKSSSSTAKRKSAGMLYMPETTEEQTRQCAFAIERAFQNGITRQTVRLALVEQRNGNAIAPSEEENGWPGGTQQMYREAGRPLTEALLREVRATAKVIQTEEEKTSGKEAFPPEIKAQEIWDFDGSALITAESAAGPSGDVQAMVFPNTDVKYLKDIGTIHESLGKDRLFLLINPFWRNVESWGFNILAPNAKKMAQEKVFDCEGGGFQETYVLSRFSARGEDCAALKAYPHDWELFAYIEDYSYGGPMQTAIRLGSSKEEPTSAMFSALLNEREEFKMNKTMRQLNKKF